MLFDQYFSCDELWPVRRGKMSHEFFEVTDRDCVRTSHGGTLWQIMVGAEIQVDSWFPHIHRPYKTKGFAPWVSYLAFLPSHLQPPSPIA